jgi:hypothetical protein
LIFQVVAGTSIGGTPDQIDIGVTVKAYGIQMIIAGNPANMTTLFDS